MIVSLFDPLAIIYVRADDRVAVAHAEAVIEEGRWIEMKQGWRARADSPHVNGMMHHVHIEFRRNQVAVINRDGSPSHGSNLDRVPGRILRNLRRRGLVESSHDLFVEHAGWTVHLPPELISEAIETVERWRGLRRLFASIR